MKKASERTTDIAALIEKGYIDADDDVVFYRHSDACNCFGHNYKQFMRALARHPIDSGRTIWFPRFYSNDIWENRFADNEDTVYERKKQNNESYVEDCLREPGAFNRLLFAKVEEASGEKVYRFKGRYEIDVETSRQTKIITYRRKDKRANTYGMPKT